MKILIKEDYYHLDDYLIIYTEYRFFVRCTWVKWDIKDDKKLFYSVADASVINDSLILESKWRFNADEPELKDMKSVKEYLDSLPKWDKTKYWSSMDSDKRMVV
jgi:hypothetical protein